MLKKLKKQDWILTSVTFLLTFIGVVIIYSSTFTAKTALEGAGTVTKQIIFIILGFCIYFGISLIDFSIFKFKPLIILISIVNLALLVVVLIFGETINNTKRWIEFGFIRIQPSEYSKIVLILLFVLFFKKNKFSFKSIKTKNNSYFEFFDKVMLLLRENLKKILIFFYALIAIYLVQIEPALTNALITVFIILMILILKQKNQIKIWSKIFIFVIVFNLLSVLTKFELFESYPVGVNFLKFFLLNFNVSNSKLHEILFVLFSLFFVFVFCKISKEKIVKIFPMIIFIVVSFFLISNVWEHSWNSGIIKLHQKKRIIDFFDPTRNPNYASTGGWQITQSKIAIGSGRIFGKGFLQGSQSKLRLLPEAYSDFIFAAFCEEFGLIGASIILTLYIIFFARILRIAKLSNNKDEFMIVIAFGVMFLVHISINISTNLGILPVTGIPLPLVSYGGSSIMVSMISLGMIQSIYSNFSDVDIGENLMIRS